GLCGGRGRGAAPGLPGSPAGVGGGDVEEGVPYQDRGDEVGALARSIAAFREAMLRKVELGRSVETDAAGRARRQEEMSAEVSRFAAEVEATLSELGRISDHMLAASTRLGGPADNAPLRPAE